MAWIEAMTDDVLADRDRREEEFQRGRAAHAAAQDGLYAEMWARQAAESPPILGTALIA